MMGDYIFMAVVIAFLGYQAVLTVRAVRRLERCCIKEVRDLTDENKRLKALLSLTKEQHHDTN